MEAATQEEEPRQRHHQSAPIFPMAQRKIVSVEHPGVIRNLENGLKTLDKRDGLEKVCGLTCKCVVIANNSSASQL
jgi:hypothetical protein